eukprot:EC095487.1.p1 GENE.EC095487.1~~EC095487.1.p1  ORF type:complete len:110 (-),score=10.28 EC095487.1:195-524(-)
MVQVQHCDHIVTHIVYIYIFHNTKRKKNYNNYIFQPYFYITKFLIITLTSKSHPILSFIIIIIDTNNNNSNNNTYGLVKKMIKYLFIKHLHDLVQKDDKRNFTRKHYIT